MIILRNKQFSAKYNPVTKRYEGKITKGDTLKSAAILGTTGAILGGIAGSAFGSNGAKKGAALGGVLGSGAGMYFTRQSRFDKHNRKMEEADQIKKNNYQKELLNRRNNLPISYADFKKRYPVQAGQLKGFESQCFNDEYPGNIAWFEQGGLEKGRYLPIASLNEYDNLMFDTKTKKYVVVDSEELEPEELRGGAKNWFNSYKA